MPSFIHQRFFICTGNFTILLRRKRGNERGSGQKISKSKESALQVWDRDIVCIPKKDGESPISFPRGKSRAKLAPKGLKGKIRLSSLMTEIEMEKEVRSVFSRQMQNQEYFPFVFLKCTGAGSKSLRIPSKSVPLLWTPQLVAKLGTNNYPIYILAQDKLSLPDIEVTLYHAHDLCVYNRTQILSQAMIGNIQERMALTNLRKHLLRLSQTQRNLVLSLSRKHLRKNVQTGISSCCAYCKYGNTYFSV